MPISIVMFPLVSEYHAKGERYSHLLLASLGIMLLIIIPLVALYFLYPELIISLFPNNKYLTVAPLLGPMGIFYSLYSLNALITHFYLSIQKIFPTIIGVIAAVLQIIFLYLFHSSLEQMVWVSVAISSVLLVILLVYYPYARQQQAV